VNDHSELLSGDGRPSLGAGVVPLEPAAKIVDGVVDRSLAVGIDVEQLCACYFDGRDASG